MQDERAATGRRTGGPEHPSAVQVERLNIVCQVAVAAHRAPSLDAVYQHAIDALVRGVGAHRAAVLMFDDNDVCRFQASRGLSRRYLTAVEGHSPWRPDEVGAAPILVPDVAFDTSLGECRAAVIAEGIGALAFIPLHGRDRLVGKFMVYFDRPHAFDPHEVEVAEAIAESIATAVERVRSEAALEAERRLFIAGPTVVFKWRNEAGWPVEYVSPNVTGAFGYAPRVLLEGVPAFADLVHPDDIDRIAAEVQHHTADGREWFQQEYRLRNASGDYRWVYDFTVVVRDAAGRVTHYHGYLQDTTERKIREAEQRRIERRMQEVQRLESLGVLAGGIAHDFNNLLMGVLGNASLALDDVAPDAPVRERLDDIIASARRAAELTRQLLAYAGKARLSQMRLDVSQLVGEMLQLLTTVVSKKAAITCHLPAGLPEVEGDVAQLRQVVMNLVTNASDALGSQAGSITISTGVEDVGRDGLPAAPVGADVAPGTYVFLQVADTGAGMDAEMQRRIFEPFFTTKFACRRLGLAAVMGIARAHLGALTVESVPGRGSTFRLWLPAAARVPAGPAIRPHAGLRATAGTVLLVDDEATIRRIAAKVLGLAGFHVVEAANGREALERLQDQDFQPVAVVLDLTMPVMSGHEAFRELRQLRPHLPVLLSSGYGKQDAGPEAAGDQHAAFLQKPYVGDELVAAVRKLAGLVQS